MTAGLTTIWRANEFHGELEYKEPVRESSKTSRGIVRDPLFGCTPTCIKSEHAAIVDERGADSSDPFKRFIYQIVRGC